MYCPNCRTINENKYRFCYQCGFTLPVIPVEEEPFTPAEPIPVAMPVLVDESASVEEIVSNMETDSIEEPVAEEIVPIEETEEVDTPAVETAAEQPIPVEQIAEEQPAPMENTQPSPTKKGSLLVPLLILITMMAIGLWAFFSSHPSSEKSKSDAKLTPWFSINNGVLSFDESKYDGSTELVVPSTVNGQTVNAIGKGCFMECRNLTTVILPDTVTEIRQQAFSDCTSLRGIFIPESVRRIEANAFSNCHALEAIHLSENLKTLDQRAFSRCRNLVHIFYTGSYKEWTELYAGVLPNDAWIYCEDGNFPYAAE